MPGHGRRGSGGAGEGEGEEEPQTSSKAALRIKTISNFVFLLLSVLIVGKLEPKIFKQISALAWI